MTAFYNEIDPYAAQWLRNLIAAGRIAPGVVDERSIQDIKPEELHDYTQCHFFAGIGVWSFALRHAGWPDDRPIWTGSCPCQPFSAAGAGGGFDDERHLWPDFHHLIAECRPATVLGEQVASRDADPWIDLVQDDLEALGYAVGAVPFPSAGVGAPHIRDRLYWVANANDSGQAQGRAPRGKYPDQGYRFAHGGQLGGLANPHQYGRTARAGAEFHDTEYHAESRGDVCGLGHADHARLEGLGGRHQTEGGRIGTAGPAAAAGESGGLADTDGWHAGAERQQRRGEQRQQPQDSGGGIGPVAAGPTNGYWAAADWLGCRDGKWRPVEPGTFPLAHGAASRVGRLRAYGNAINAEAARVFVQAVMGAL